MKSENLSNGNATKSSYTKGKVIGGLTEILLWPHAVNVAATKNTRPACSYVCIRIRDVRPKLSPYTLQFIFIFSV